MNIIILRRKKSHIIFRKWLQIPYVYVYISCSRVSFRSNHSNLVYRHKMKMCDIHPRTHSGVQAPRTLMAHGVHVALRQKFYFSHTHTHIWMKNSPRSPSNLLFSLHHHSSVRQADQCGVYSATCWYYYDLGRNQHESREPL